MKTFLSIIIPTHNNARTLALTLLDIRHHLERLDFRHEIIIVDDHSTDGSVEVARRFMLLMKPIQVVSYQGAAGFLGAVRHGASVARGNYYFVFPPDPEATFDDIEKMLPRVESNQVQIVFGVRRHVLTLWRRIVQRLLAVFRRDLLQDPESHCFLMRSDVSATALPRLQINGAPLALGLARLAQTMGYCYAETLL